MIKKILIVLTAMTLASCASIKDWMSTVMFSKPNEYIIYAKLEKYRVVF